jgi:acetyltransferase
VVAAVYPKEFETVLALPSGKPLRVRPIKPDDESLLVDMAARMNPDDLRLRFFGTPRALSHELAARLSAIDYATDMALIAQSMTSDEILGVARYFADADKGDAEFAVMVRSDWHGRGVGWLLMEKLVAVARARGIGSLTGLVLRANTNMLAFCRDLGFTITANPDDPLTVHASFALR